MNNPIIRFTGRGQMPFSKAMPGSRLRRVAAPLWLALGMIGFAGCSLVPEVQPDPTRFYLLTATETATPVGTTAVAEKPVRLLLRSVVVPEFLRGRVMQVRLAENEVKFVDEARWAEPLEAALNRVLRENFLQHGGVQVVGRGGESHDYEISVQLRRFEGVSPAGVARIAARIEVYSGDVDTTLLAQDDFTTDVPGWDGKDFGQLAGKLSVAAATLSERIFTLLPAKSS